MDDRENINFELDVNAMGRQIPLTFRFLFIAGTMLVLMSLFPVLENSNYKSSADFHSIIEITGSMIGLVVGLAFMLRFYTMGNRLYLFIGLAFFINGIEDLIHGCLAFRFLSQWFGMPASTFKQFIPGTYVTGRILHGVLLILAPLAPALWGQCNNPKKETIWTSTIVLALTAVATFFAFITPLPRFIYPDNLISRPVDLLSAGVLFIAMLGLLHYFKKTRDPITWWIALSLGINVVGQIQMSFSKSLFDAFFDISHVYKVLGYLVPMVGFTIYQIALLRVNQKSMAALQATAEDASMAKKQACNRLIKLEAQTRDLEVAREEAQAASLSKSTFLANMSHEIRTPMTAILGYTDLLLDPTESKCKQKLYVQTIQDNAKSLMAIINDILDLSKIEAGKMSTERIPFSICSLVSDVASLMRIRAQEKNLELSVEYATPMPLNIQSDPVRLRQILVNLVGNAIKFTEQGGVRLIVRCSSPADANPVLAVDVLDTGIGMTEKQQRSLFQPFTQADTSTTRKFGGTGLGLTISKRLAEILGGDIQLQSSPECGSCFKVSIDPGDLTQTTMLLDPTEAVTSRSAATTGANLTPLCGRVLVAEDNPVNQKLIRRILEKMGLNVHVASDGLEAFNYTIDSLKSNQPIELVLMDMQMPVMDGCTAMSKLREAGFTGPIVALTANAMAQDRQKCFDAGSNAFVTKPIDREQLNKTLMQFLPTRTPIKASA